jgi:hypothetical protein
MAQMIPRDTALLPSETTTSERALYRAIERYTPESWICYCGQRLGCGTTPDFVLIGPEIGVIILEEKGLPIHRIKSANTEKWTIVRGGEYEEKTHPLRQARGYALTAQNLLKKVKSLTKDDGRLKFVCGHGVVLSEISKNELCKNELFEIGDLSETFEIKKTICSDEIPRSSTKHDSFVDKIHEMSKLFKFDNLSEDDLNKIRYALYPEARVKSFGDITNDRNAVIFTLSVKQEQFAKGIGLNDKIPHRLINGVVGSGKSIVLKSRALSVAAEHPEWKILITFFTRSLTGMFKKDIPNNVTILSIGQAVKKAWTANKLDDKYFDPYSADGWSKIAETFRNGLCPHGVYDAIFLDEAQDISADEADCLRHLLSPETNCAFFVGDNIQNIFRKKVIWKNHGFKFVGRSSKIDFTINYRNTKQIFDFAIQFILDNSFKDEGEGIYKDIKFDCEGTMKPTMENYISNEDEMYHILNEIERLVKDGASFNSIAIILPNSNNKNIADPYINEMKSRSLNYYWLAEDKKSKSGYSPDRNSITITTPESSKGLEWLTVFMPSINAYHGESARNLKFVAATRALNRLSPSTIA